MRNCNIPASLIAGVLTASLYSINRANAGPLGQDLGTSTYGNCGIHHNSQPYKDFVGALPGGGYPPEYAWANRINSVGACLGDSYPDVRRSGFGRTFNAMCNNKECQVAFNIGGLKINGKQYSPSQIKAWYPGNEPSINQPGAVIPEALSVDSCYTAQNKDPIPSRRFKVILPSIEFFVLTSKNGSQEEAISFSVSEYRCDVLGFFVDLVGDRKKF